VDWLGVDVDPVGDENVFSVAAEINDYLLGLGFPEAGVFGSSGRGFWLLWRVEQDNTPEATDLRRRFLLALKRRWTQVDAATYNASRVARLFGTVNLKNRNPVSYTASPRPHRCRPSCSNRLLARHQNTPTTASVVRSR
jgi:hypothetical protein